MQGLGHHLPVQLAINKRQDNAASHAQRGRFGGGSPAGINRSEHQTNQQGGRHQVGKTAKTITPGDACALCFAMQAQLVAVIQNHKNEQQHH